MTRVGLTFIVFAAIINAATAQNTPESLIDNSLAGLPYAEGHALFISQFDAVFAPLPDINVDHVPEVWNDWRNWSTIGNFTYGKDRGAMTMITDLNALHPYLRDQVKELIRLCKAKGIDLAIVETYRTVAKQNEYKSMGKKYTRSAGGLSKHQYGLAIDVVPMIDSVAVWNNITMWRKIGPIGEKLGLRWGGRWRHPFDPGHFEWSGGLTGTQMSAGTYPQIPNSSSYPCLEEEIGALRENWKAWEAEQSAVVRRN